jgi:photosystem II stability/assembly factor-like uncharacterized protein
VNQQIDRRTLIGGAAALGVVNLATPAIARKAALVAPEPAWVKLPAEPYRGKQDDVFFVSRSVGWYGNGLGRVFKTVDGGQTWTKVLDRPGTYVRAMGFVDEKLGFLGNIGPDYFPGVTDPQPLYRTRDGGLNWAPVTGVEGPAAKGICAIDIQRLPFINAGVLDERVVIRAGGRVGSPAFLMESRDEGETWRSKDMGRQTAMILDIKFVDARTGFIAGATDANVQASRALVLRTTDGGHTWSKVYESARPWEVTWKLSFPTPRVGYVTVQNYNPDKGVSGRVVAKTVDGGKTWREYPVIDDHAFTEFGIAFLNEKRGWIGGSNTGVETFDGGKTWRKVDMGRAVNKIRIVRDSKGTSVFAIGMDLYRLDLSA